MALAFASSRASASWTRKLAWHASQDPPSGYSRRLRKPAQFPYQCAVPVGAAAAGHPAAVGHDDKELKGLNLLVLKSSPRCQGLERVQGSGLGFPPVPALCPQIISTVLARSVLGLLVISRRESAQLLKRCA